MLGILVMLNDYFHDFATAIAIISTYVMLLLLRHVQNDDKAGPKDFLLLIYPKAVHITGGIVALLLMAGIVRAFTYSWFGSDQVWLLMAKHVVMFSVFGYGLYLWIKMHKVIKTMRGK